MKKTICQKFVDFKIRHSLSNDVIAKMVTEYANSDFQFARTYYSEKYFISRSTFYKARDYAVIFCLVDNTTYKKLLSKSATNCKNHNEKNSSVASEAHYKDLLAERQLFLNSFSQNEIKDIAFKYLDGISLKKIAIAYDTGELAIKYMLKKGITSLILDATTVKGISMIAGNSLVNILQERESNKKRVLDCLQKQITFLQAQIACYDLYFMNLHDKPSLEVLQSNLSDVISYQNKVRQL